MSFEEIESKARKEEGKKSQKEELAPEALFRQGEGIACRGKAKTEEIADLEVHQGEGNPHRGEDLRQGEVRPLPR